MAHTPVYLDSHATTPVDPRVVTAMLPYFTQHFGNPASASHAWGWKAAEAVEASRREIATLIGATAREIVFTSGATESNNFAISGAAARAPAGRRTILTSAIEHKSVLEASHRLEAAGWHVTVLPVAHDGRLNLDALGRALGPDTAIVSVMAANNEIGVIEPLADIGRMAHEAGAVFHVDAAQAVGKVPIDVNAMGIDLLALTGHKMYGPKGCGALFVRKRTELLPLIVGGGQERGLRSGTLNVPGIVGLGQACAICRAEMAAESKRLAVLRDHLLKGLQDGLEGLIVNGSLEHRLPHNLHLTFTNVDHSSLVLGIGDIAVSSGSACGSASAEPSHVLRAIEADSSENAASIRFGLSRFTTDEEIEYTIEKFTTVVRKLRATAPEAGVHDQPHAGRSSHEDHGRA